ncbi:MAG: hypothetical protein R3Y13_05050 [bacterium]
MSKTKKVEESSPKKKKKIRVILLILIGILLLAAIGITFGYFIAMGDLSEGSDVTIDVAERANLEFSTSADLSINATMTNFIENGGNLSDSITGNAVLTAGEEYSEGYNIYYEITDNEFIYTTGEDKTPELILQVLNPEGDEVMSIPGLEYVTSNGVSGFDITTKSGTFEIAGNYVITTDGIDPTEQEWTFTLFFMNLETNQNDNAGKEFVSKATFQRDGVELEDFESNVLYENILVNSSTSGHSYSSVETAISSIEAKGNPNFELSATTDEGVYSIEDDFGTSYYYRGAVTNNWVEFAGAYWRIVRIDGNGDIKLIYSGTDKPQDDSAVLTGAGTQLGEYGYRDDICDSCGPVILPSYSAGYVFTADELHGKTTDSYIKTVVEEFYTNNIESYSSFLTQSEYCIDRVNYSQTLTDGIYSYASLNNEYSEGAEQYFGAATRVGILTSSVEPTLMCSNESDKLQVNIGLISADEISLAGGIDGDNTSYYLYTGQDFWTITPMSYDSPTPYIFTVTNTGSFGNKTKGNVGFAELGVRPTVTLKSEVTITSGTGIGTDPYVIG